MFDLGDVALGLLLALVAGLWWQGHAVRERALALTRAHCRRFEVQLLDETVVLRQLRPVRSGAGLRLRRVYEFEFSSTGDQRYRGWTVMEGARLQSIDLQAHRLH
jgi:hypothetical protein